MARDEFFRDDEENTVYENGWKYLMLMVVECIEDSNYNLDIKSYMEICVKAGNITIQEFSDKQVITTIINNSIFLTSFLS